MRENIIPFIYGLLVALIIALIQQIITFTISCFKNKNNYTVNGFYISKYISAFDESITANDLVLIRSLRRKIFVEYQQYYNKSQKCRIFKGEGYIGNNSRIAISYQYSDKNTFQSGVMLITQIDLEATKKAFAGKFFEFDTRIVKSNGQRVIGCDSRIYGIDYILIPINLKLSQKIKFIIGKNVYVSHDQISEDFDYINEL